MKSLALIDFKTSRGGSCYVEYRIQGSGYATAWNRMNRRKVKKVVILCLDKETGLPTPYIIEGAELKHHWQSFCAIRAVYKLLGLEPKRFYGSIEFPSMTTVLGILDKPALVQWAANSVHEHFTNHLAELRNPATSELRITQILREGKTAHRKVSERAMSTGTLVHKAIETRLAGADPSEMLKGQDQALTAFDAFISWEWDVNLKPIALEQQLIYQPSRECLGWGGTADCIAEISL